MKGALENQMKEAQKQREVEVKRLRGIADKLKEFLTNEGITVRDAAIILEGVLGNLKQQMAKKYEHAASPIIDEWNAKSLKDFYASETKPDKPA